MPLQRHQLTSDALWNTESYYKTPSDWQRDFDDVAEEHSRSPWALIKDLQGRLGNIDQAKSLLDLYFDLQRQIGKLYTFAHMRRDEKTSCEESQIRFHMAKDLFHKFQIATAWIDPEFTALGDQLNAFAHSEALKSHAFYLKKLQRRQLHSLPPDQEALLALAQKALSTSHLAFEALNDTDLKFEPAVDQKGLEHELTHGTYAPLLRQSDRALRRSAFEKIHSAYRDHQHLMAQLLQGCCQTHAFEARIRRFESSLHAALFEHEIPTSLYQNLIAAVKGRAGAMRRYMALRKKVLGIDELNTWDLQVPLVEEMSENYPFEKAVELIIASSAPLGEEYVDILRAGLGRDRWVDRSETLDKRSGAYSSGCWGQLPLILLNYQGALQDVFTLAHEAGHSMHSYFSWEAQPYQTGDYSIFAAEVASTLSEELLLLHLLKKAPSKRAKARLIYQKIEEIRATLFRQTLFAEFEWRAHQLCEKGIGLTPKSLNRLYRSLNQEYCNEGCALTAIGDSEWARIPHFYYNFYVFQYATGISAALQLSGQMMGKDAPAARKRYLTFLKSGGSDFPVNQLRRAGVDMTTKAPVDAALDRFEELVEELESLLESR